MSTRHKRYREPRTTIYGMKKENNMKKIHLDDLYRLCNREKYFTCGTVTAYERMFDLAEKGVSKGVLAAVIWACSDDTANLNEITRQLEQIEVVDNG